jgi:ribosome-binding protein aMBF1 (putative translation factor)
VRQAVETIASWGELGSFDEMFAETLRRARADADRATARRYGAWIRDVRRSLGMSLREFAPRIGTSASRWSSYEQGTVTPGGAIIRRVERLTPGWSPPCPPTAAR